jgi:hypothetical protein
VFRKRDFDAAFDKVFLKIQQIATKGGTDIVRAQCLTPLQMYFIYLKNTGKI